jgi:hypothetical protein
MNEIMQPMNADHKDGLVLLAQKFAGTESQEATMTAVDRLGFHRRLRTRDGVKAAGGFVVRETARTGSCPSDPFCEIMRRTRMLFLLAGQ